MTSIAESLPAQINRVRKVQDYYKELRGMPNVIVEPQIEMMEHDIQSGIGALASGDVAEMIEAHEALKGWKE
jgi:hypothetical protein